MNSKQALKLAQAKFGKSAYVRDLGATYADGTLRPIDADDLAKLVAERKRVQEAQPVPRKLEDWPDETTLGEYKAYLALHKKARDKWEKARNAIQSKCLSADRYEVGHIIESGTFGVRFSSIDGHGRSWEEALIDAKCLPRPRPEVDSDVAHAGTEGD